MANNKETENNSHSSASENEEILRLTKQTHYLRYDSKVTRLTRSVQFKCLNSQNEPVSRPWDIKADTTDKWLTLIGKDTTEDNSKYLKSFCNVDVYVNKWRKACSCQLPLKGPDFREFTFDQIASWIEIDKTFKPVSLVLIKITLGIEDEMIDGINQLEVGNFMNNTFLSDCVIKTEGKQFPCHKVLLAAKSEYFKTMFSSEMKEANENEIDWTTVFDADTVNDLLHFIYTAKIPPNIDNTCQKLIHVASLCCLKDLQEICGERLETQVNQENSLEILLLAKKYEMEKLKEVAVKFMAVHKEEILMTTAWNETKVEMARDLFSSAMDVMRDVMSQKPLEN